MREAQDAAKVLERHNEERRRVERQMQDELALTSQQRAARAIAEGRFDSQIVPIEIASRKGTVTFDTDEHVRGEVNAEQLAKMKPASSISERLLVLRHDGPSVRCRVPNRRACHRVQANVDGATATTHTSR